MLTSTCLFACALAVGQAPDRADWQLALPAGMELVYSGSYVEEALIPNVNYQRRYRLEATLLVLEAGRGRWDIALMTSLSPRPQNPDYKSKPKEQPASVRLELASLDGQGHLRGQASLAVPHSGPPTIECGMLVETPILKAPRGQLWEVNDEGRTPRSWQVVGAEAVSGITCIKVVGMQQSDDWDHPRGDQAAWRRHDTVWLIPQAGVAQKVERIIECREPARREPTHRSVVRYELESRLTYPGRFLEDRRREILKAKKFQDDARPFLAQPGQYRPQIDALHDKLTHYLAEQAPTPYRKALVSLQARLDSARRGEAAPEIAGEEIARTSALALGQRVPDFVVADLTGNESARLARLLGKPVLVFFYNPATATGSEVLRFALELHQRHAGRLGFMAMAVTNDAGLARKQHADMKLPFPVLDGKGMHLTFSVDATPRFALLDGEGILRYTSTGWGVHTSREITDEIGRCLAK